MMLLHPVALFAIRADDFYDQVGASPVGIAAARVVGIGQIEQIRLPISTGCDIEPQRRQAHGPACTAGKGHEEQMQIAKNCLVPVGGHGQDLHEPVGEFDEQIGVECKVVGLTPTALRRKEQGNLPGRLGEDVSPALVRKQAGVGLPGVRIGGFWCLLDHLCVTSLYQYGHAVGCGLRNSHLTCSHRCSPHPFT